MSFLDNLTKTQIENGKFPLEDVLHNSFYYPSCGFDGGIVKDCNTLGAQLKIVSFIYCDYATGELFKSQQNTFAGYHIFGTRNVSHSELTPKGWQLQIPPNVNLQDYQRYKGYWKPFINWTVYERDENQGDERGPEKFSLLYLGGEGVATYQALYWSNNFTAKALAIIQPGTAFGGNWTDFTAKDGALAWVVNNNPSGSPDIIYYGGYGQGYNDLDWKGYTASRLISSYYLGMSGEVRIWGKAN